MNNMKPLRAYFGHHKCASSWLNAINLAVCRELSLKLATVHSPVMFENNLDRFVEENQIDFLTYSNADIQFVRELDDFLGFHVIRDPRDIVVSAYFSHLYSHPTEGWPELVEHRKKLQNVNKEEGLFLEMKFSEKNFRNLYNWNYSQNNVLELKVEEITPSPYEAIIKMMSFLELVQNDGRASLKQRTKDLLGSVINRVSTKSKGLLPIKISKDKIPVNNLLGYVYKNRFSKMAEGRKKGDEDVKSHYRKGIAGDWVNHFNKDHTQFFKENYNDLLIKLGYEKTPNW